MMNYRTLLRDGNGRSLIIEYPPQQRTILFRDPYQYQHDDSAFHRTFFLKFPYTLFIRKEDDRDLKTLYVLFATDSVTSGNSVVWTPWLPNIYPHGRVCCAREFYLETLIYNFWNQPFSLDGYSGILRLLTLFGSGKYDYFQNMEEVTAILNKRIVGSCITECLERWSFSSYDEMISLVNGNYPNDCIERYCRRYYPYDNYSWKLSEWIAINRDAYLTMPDF